MHQAPAVPLLHILRLMTRSNRRSRHRRRFNIAVGVATAPPHVRVVTAGALHSTDVHSG
jgi:hypothetical protein